MLDGFKKFIARGNMVDMAVGVIMGAAVTTVVNSIVDDVINPLIAMIFGKPDLSNTWTITYNGATVSFGAVLNAVINFLLIAIAVYFCIVLPINKFRDFTQAQMAKHRGKDTADVAKEDADLSPDEQTVILLQEIRDSLKKQNEAAEAEAREAKHATK
ncbi:large conductance mechanosensitive channel protein MscL [Bifidobacterium choloepi]|uniref:Large-conductance mechanosensitive channel n=1 Tax=Bifidobacterium choloepi TaxID=2614131 RepID=A0A6I5NMM7_9BIFI|nr:large conductance mechanosensitive channel protein MscL [Bifidobacterium choloepi]NEG69992.1 large conductance mechanosensitive channel protein MscL [Bifidobacterium choloepi]